MKICLRLIKLSQFLFTLASRRCEITEEVDQIEQKDHIMSALTKKRKNWPLSEPGTCCSKKRRIKTPGLDDCMSNSSENKEKTSLNCVTHDIAA